MNSDNTRKGARRRADRLHQVPRWQKLVMTDAGIDRRYYELCALSELKNSLRSGDIWVQGSRQFKDFEDYLVPPAKFASRLCCINQFDKQSDCRAGVGFRDE